MEGCPVPQVDQVHGSEKGGDENDSENWLDAREEDRFQQEASEEQLLGHRASCPPYCIVGIITCTSYDSKDDIESRKH